jgi:hypothetical protein
MFVNFTLNYFLRKGSEGTRQQGNEKRPWLNVKYGRRFRPCMFRVQYAAVFAFRFWLSAVFAFSLQLFSLDASLTLCLVALFCNFTLCNQQ